MRKAFTLIELLVYIAIFSVVVVAFVTIFISIIRIQSNQSSEAEVETQAQYLLGQIQYYVQQSDLINAPLDTATTTLVLDTSSSTENPITLTLASGTVYIQETASGTPQAITSNAITISNLTFTRHTNSTSSPDSVSVAFTISYNTANPQQAFSQQVQTSIAALNHYGLGYEFQLGSYGTGSGQLQYPWSLAVDRYGNVWVTDPFGNRIEEFNSSGTYVTQIGCASGACPSSSSTGKFSDPADLVFDSSGNIWALDTGNCRIEEFNASGTSYLSGFGSCGNTNGTFQFSYGLAFDSNGHIWVADKDDNRIEKFSTSGSYLGQVGCASGACTATSTNGQFSNPLGIAFDPSGNLWVADELNNRIEEFNASGTPLGQFGTYGAGSGQLDEPYAVAIGPNGNIFVADTVNNRIEEFNSNGVYLAQAGNGVAAGNSNGEFSSPSGLVFDSSGNLWVADYGNARAEEFVTR